MTTTVFPKQSYHKNVLGSYSITKPLNLSCPMHHLTGVRVEPSYL